MERLCLPGAAGAACCPAWPDVPWADLLSLGWALTPACVQHGDGSSGQQPWPWWVFPGTFGFQHFQGTAFFLFKPEVTGGARLAAEPHSSLTASETKESQTLLFPSAFQRSFHFCQRNTGLLPPPPSLPLQQLNHAAMRARCCPQCPHCPQLPTRNLGTSSPRCSLHGL